MLKNKFIKLIGKSVTMYLLGFRNNIKCLFDRVKWNSLLNDAAPIKLNIGSGPCKGKNGFVNVDFFGADIAFDFRKKIPLPDGCVDEVYSSHMLEHLHFNQIISLFGEIRRILKDDGKFNICVPDASFYIHAYVERRFHSLDCQSLYGTNSFIDQLNYIAYMGEEHKFMFDINNINSMLLKTGFSKVEKRPYDINIDLDTHVFESLYVRAFK